MGCTEFKKLWEKYENGTLTYDEQEQLESHIETCEECEAYLDELLSKSEPIKKRLPPQNLKVPFWKIKWKQRWQTFSFVLAVCIAIYFVGHFASSFYFYSNNMKNLTEVDEIPALALEATMPNSRSAGGSTKIKPFFRTENEMNFFKTVGKKEFPIGTVTTSSFLSSVAVTNQSWENRAYSKKLSFVHPQIKQVDHLKESSKKVWDTLEKVHEGTVAEVALSFDKLYTLQELESLLYSVFEAQEMPPTPIWYALDTGQERINENDFILHGGEMIRFPEHINLPDSEAEQPKTKEDEVIEMMRILSINKEIVSKTTWTREKDLNLDKRYQYVKDNGVKVYGIVITGPSKELLKLQNSPHVRYATLGDIEVWNWFDY
ncbi:anti-sigma factor [Bacillus wiedmannii]|uniref:anti-sigma factor n=1 Tax=Bacillus wiedmannii TaxID=1890302 RepID=UPI000BF06C85|nr:anti-sigma factor [Bacillus wiedmannii]PEI67832.1 sigma-M negative effector [Bacillus wiedmannii]PFZ65166.1 sigma-M negative effector [Bacillus wiedmannii]PHB63812.1 sigma-M negative effector [Bacillus wiedmannii]PHE03556.1 sigma-M negative effector [Bacillus wiedmannii]PHG72442.1 sigma-M negative effector [Bacillus wiedmannii]